MQKRHEIEVHPFAARFPMLPEDELQDLAADIKENGQQYPIALDPNGVLLDGRNRLRACEIAGVEPITEVYDGDPVACIVARNIKHRYLNAGQRAIALAFAYPEPEKGGRGKNVEARKAQETWGFSSERLRQARAILHHSRDLAEQVFADTKKFDAALTDVREAEQQRQSDEAKLARLQARAPDLAAHVAEGMDLDEAVAALAEREKRDEQRRDTATRLLHNAMIFLNPGERQPTAWAEKVFPDIDITKWPPSGAAELSFECVRACAEALSELARLMEEADG